MRAEIMMIGTELLLGQITDTNAVFMARVLAENGINLHLKTTVGDNRERIVAALDAALDRADVVLCSGGLGPTEDDITRECVAGVFGRPLVYHPGIFEAILARFAHTGRKVTENNKRQAMVPEGGIVVENPHGTAPGLIMEGDRGVVVCMPGVPHELKPMLSEWVVPWLRQRFGLSGVLVHRSLRVCGMGESRVDDLIGDLILAGSNPTIGLLAGPDGVTVRIAARAEDRAAAEALIAPVEAAVQARLGGMAFGGDGQTLESLVDGALRARGWRMAVADAATGGEISRRLLAADAAGFGGGVVLPSESALEWAGNTAGSLLPEGAPEEFGAPPGDPLARIALDLTRRILLEYPFDSALSVVSSSVEHRSTGVFWCPEGCRFFGMGHYGGGALDQTRQAVTALEQVRRFLVGLPATA